MTMGAWAGPSLPGWAWTVTKLSIFPPFQLWCWGTQP